MNFRLIAAGAICALVLCTGCSKTIVSTKKIDYKSQQKQTAPLEIPPDLPSPSVSDRYALPDSPSRGAATYSEYAQEKPRVQTQTVAQVFDGARVERAGTQRWLVVKAPPEAVWPVLRDFWQEQGFVLAIDDAKLGIMETDWAENRAKIPQGIVRDLVGKVFDQAYSSPELDKFKTRVERGDGKGGTEIYISHRGAYEVFVADANLRNTGKTMWQPRQSDPNLEAEMLTRLAVKFGTPQQEAQSNVKTARPEPRATLDKAAEAGPVLKLKDDFDRAWRRVGLSLDRLGFAVQDRDRSSGLYYIRYLVPPTPTKEEGGLLSKLAFWRKDEPVGNKPADYRVSIKQSGEGTQVVVLNASGKQDRSEAATRMLTILQEDLR